MKPRDSESRHPIFCSMSLDPFVFQSPSFNYVTFINSQLGKSATIEEINALNVQLQRFSYEISDNLFSANESLVASIPKYVYFFF